MSRQGPQRVIGAVGVVLPVHDEEELLPGALQALEMAVNALSPSISCRVAVVLDHCGDASSAIARCWGARFGALVIRRECRSVGLARRAGSLALLARWPEKDSGAGLAGDHRCRFACAAGLAHGPAGGPLVRRGSVGGEGPRWLRRAPRYGGGRSATRPNGIRSTGRALASAPRLYTQLGGFRSLRSGEDRDFHDRAVAAGFRIAYDFRAAVTTSSRRMGRAPEGFASVLDTVEQKGLEATA